MKRIICPIDFSNASKNAARYAAQIARKFRISLSLAYLANNSAIQMADTADFEESAFVDEDLELNLQHLCENLRNNYTINCSGYFLSRKKLLTEIENVKDDTVLIVSGIDWKRDLEDYSNEIAAMELLNKLDKPLLIVPEEYNYAPVTRIVFGSKYGDLDLRALRELITLFDPVYPDIYVVHVSNRFNFQKTQEFQDYIKTIENTMPGEDQLHFHHIYGTDVSNALVNFSAEVLNQIIAVVADNNNVFQKARIAKLIQISDLPVLLMPG